MLQRTLSLPKSKSSFLFGPRQTGKSTLINSWLGPNDLYINLLVQSTYLSYSREPSRFRQEILAHLKKYPQTTVFLDEVQRIPALLDEVHALIEEKKCRFLMTGSSARKLKRGGANLLAGRAYSFQLFPLTFEELHENFELEKALQIGCLPVLWNTEAQEDPKNFLRTYAETYLKEEIQSEGLVRNIGPFARFLDVMGTSDGEIVNYSTIGRDCGVSVKTVQEYYRILEDTFLAIRLDPWIRSVRKRLSSHPKYYLFDMGIANAIAHTGLRNELDTVTRGRRFEQFIILQSIALNHYYQLDLNFNFWRTYTGAEVDLLISRGSKILAAVEIKSSSRIHPADLSGLQSFLSENAKVPAWIVCMDERPRELKDGITSIPWKEFLERLKNM